MASDKRIEEQIESHPPGGPQEALAGGGGNPANPLVNGAIARWVALLVVACGIGLFGLFYYVHLNLNQASRGRHDNDFKHLWAGAWLVAEGESPYDRAALQEIRAMIGAGGINPYVYLPYTAQAMQPLAALSIREASTLWFWLNHLFFWGGVALFLTARWPTAPNEEGVEGESKARSDWWTIALQWLLAAGCLAPSMAFYRTLTAGQLNLALFFGWGAVFWALSRQRDALAGGIAAFIALFKITPGILGVYFLARYRWRALAAMVATTAVLLLLSFAQVGVGRYAEFIPLLQNMSYGKSTWGDVNTFYRDPGNHSINSFLHHTLVDHRPDTTPWIEATPETANALTRQCAILILILVFVFSIIPVWRRRGMKPWVGRDWKAIRGEFLADLIPRFGYGERLLFGAFIMASLLIPSLMWDHYMTIAAGAWLILLRHLTRPERAPSVGGIIALVLLSVAMGWPVNYWDPAFHSGVGLITMSIRLWPTLALFVWALVLGILHERMSKRDKENG